MPSGHKHEPLKRVFIWTNPRSLGTVFLKCVSQIPDTKVINGLYVSCFYYGPEATFPRGLQTVDDHNLNGMEEITTKFTNLYDSSKVTYSWAKSQFERSYPGKKYLFCKDTPSMLCENYNLIPPGFSHTFLIRHPYRMWSAWKRVFGPDWPQPFDVKTAVKKYLNNYFYYKEQYDLLQHLLRKPELTETPPVVLDADDLQNHPESIVRQYCQAIGVPYTEDLLHWNPGTDLVKDWKISLQNLGGGLQEGESGYYKDALESTRFFPCKKLPDRDELDDDVLQCADLCLPYYEKMYNMRTMRP